MSSRKAVPLVRVLGAPAPKENTILLGSNLPRRTITRKLSDVKQERSKIIMVALLFRYLEVEMGTHKK